MNFDYCEPEVLKLMSCEHRKWETNQLNSSAILAQNLIISKLIFETPWLSGLLGSILHAMRGDFFIFGRYV
jgi:hypothetical protein